MDAFAPARQRRLRFALRAPPVGPWGAATEPLRRARARRAAGLLAAGAPGALTGSGLRDSSRAADRARAKRAR